MIDVFLLKALDLVVFSYVVLFVLFTVHLDIIRNGEKPENKFWVVIAWAIVLALLAYMWAMLLGA